jgi:hypothetical protein
MPTIPLTLVEGAVALPTSRPFDFLPANFGREWALLPPNVSFRVELKALYAAMLRTFCLSADAIRSMCRWEPRRMQPEAAVVPTVVQAPVAEVDLSKVLYAQPAPSTRGRGLAAGACVIGGVAVLTWLALDHSPVQKRRDDATTEVRSARSGEVRSEVAAARTAPARPVVSSTPASIAQVTPATVAGVAPSATPVGSTSVKADAPQGSRQPGVARQPAGSAREPARSRFATPSFMRNQGTSAPPHAARNLQVDT